MKDQLFLLRPDWTDQGRTWFCPACATVEGFLGYYPAVRDQIEVVYVSYERPRASIVALLGEAHQNAPMLVLAEPFAHPDLRDGDIQSANGRLFATDDGPVTRYLAARYGVSPGHP
jgi:hypothetical protein